MKLTAGLCQRGLVQQEKMKLVFSIRIFYKVTEAKKKLVFSIRIFYKVTEAKKIQNVENFKIIFDLNRISNHLLKNG